LHQIFDKIFDPVARSICGRTGEHRGSHNSEQRSEERTCYPHGDCATDNACRCGHSAFWTVRCGAESNGCNSAKNARRLGHAL
jgi:hypothetical protein